MYTESSAGGHLKTAVVGDYGMCNPPIFGVEQGKTKGEQNNANRKAEKQGKPAGAC